MAHFDKAKHAAESNNLNEMLHHYYLFLRQAQDEPDTYSKQLIEAYVDIGNLFVVHSDFASAKSYYDMGYALSQTYGDADGQLNSLLGLCQTCLYTGDTIAARKWNRQILGMSGVSLPNRLHTFYLNHASDHMLQNRLDSAEWYYHKDLELIDKHGINLEKKFNSLMLLCKCYTLQNEVDSALTYAHMAYDNASYSDMIPLRQLFAMRNMARLYGRKGDTERSAYYQALCYDMRDSVENVREFLAIKSEQEQFEEAQNKASIKQLSLSNSRLQGMLLLGLIVVLLLSGMIYYVLRLKRKTDMNYQALFDRNKELLQIEEEYKLMLSKTHKTDQVSSAQPSATKAERDFDQELWQHITEVLSSVDELCAPDFGLIRLTTLVDSNTTYVSQTIKAATGKNVPTLINEYRIREACRRLLDTAQYGNLTLQALAESVGFTSQSTFNRAFKQSTGLTPVIYRRLSNQQSDTSALPPKK